MNNLRRSSDLPMLVGLLAAVACGGDDAPDVPLTYANVNIKASVFSTHGERVIFNGADGRLLDEQTADRLGDARGLMEPGGMVTWAFFGELWTVAGVDPEDRIHFAMDGFFTTSGLLKVSLPGPLPGVAFYSVGNECDLNSDADPSPTAVTELFQFGPCVGHPSRVVAFAFDELGVRHAYAQADVMLDSQFNGSVALDAWKTDLATETLVLQNVPSDVVQLIAAQGFVRSRRTVNVQGLRLPVTSSQTVSFQQPPHFGTKTIYSVGLDTQPGIGAGSFFAIVEAGTSGRPLEIDVSAARLPDVTSLEVGNPTTTWTTSADLSGTDAIQLELDSMLSRWTIFMPPDRSTFTLPILPPRTEVVLPEAGEQLTGGILYLDDESYPSGWQGVKRAGTFPFPAEDVAEDLQLIRLSGR